MFPPHFTASFFGPNFFQVQIFGIVLHVLVAPLEIKPLGPGTWVLPRCKCLIWIFVLGTPGHCQRRDGRCGDFAEGQNMVGKLVSPKIHTWLLLKEYVCYTIWSLSLSLYFFKLCIYSQIYVYMFWIMLSWICRWSGIATNLSFHPGGILESTRITYALIQEVSWAMI